MLYEEVQLLQVDLNGYNISKMATWYGKTTKQLDNLIQSKPTLQQLLALPDFFQQIKSYNPKLLDYITNTPALISEAVTYLTVAPLHSDSNERKYKLPQQTIELVETQTTSILNGFFKQAGQADFLNFDLLFGMLQSQQVLPILAGYFFRANLSLLNNKYKQTVDRIYGNPKYFQGLIRNSDNMAISNTIQLYLNLDINKNVLSQPQKLTIKIDVIKSIFEKIRNQGKKKGPDSSAIVQNLCSVLIQTVDKYYLIVDGKQMIQAIVSQPNVQIMMQLIHQRNQLSFSAFSFFVAVINYYSFSSFNAEDAGSTPQTAKKNQQRLQKEPMIEGIVQLFGTAMDRIMGTPKMDLYHYRLLQMLCHCISIASARILRKIVEQKFFGGLITLLFKHQKNNILHMLIEKSFYHIFISQRKIYEEYKKHLFCQLDIIQVTASKILKMFPQNNFLEHAKKKPYIGHFMRILKIYSGIQPTDQSIIAAIKAKTNIWNKISQILIKPYEAICFKQIGTYENVPTPSTQEFTIRNYNSTPSMPKDTSAIEEINKQESYPPPRSSIEKKNSQQEDTHNYPFDNQPNKLSMIDRISKRQQPPSPSPTMKSTKSEPVNPPLPETKELKKTDSYKEYLIKQKVVAGQDIKNKKRSLSQDRRMNTSRGKMTSPSPNKRNSWKQTDQKEQKDVKSSVNSMSVKSDQPAIPKPTISRRGIAPFAPSTNERQNRFTEENKPISSSKSVNMEEVRRIKVIQIDVPKQKKYRRTDEKDKTLLQFLGIPL